MTQPKNRGPCLSFVPSDGGFCGTCQFVKDAHPVPVSHSYAPMLSQTLRFALIRLQDELQKTTMGSVDGLEVVLPPGMFQYLTDGLRYSFMQDQDELESGCATLRFHHGKVLVRRHPDEKPRQEESSAQRPDDFPTPFVSKPTLAQLVKGARVEYEGKPGEVLTGWVEQFGNLAVGYRTSSWLPPGAMVSVNQPGSMMMTFLAPTYVPLEKVLRVTCAPDPSPEECWKCHQSGVEWKGGERPCQVCCRPTVYDSAEPSTDVKPCSYFSPSGDEAGRCRFCSCSEGDHAPKVRMSPEEVMRISADGHDATRVK